MATGVFHTARTGHNLRSRKCATDGQLLARFAESISLTGTVHETATELGITPKAAHNLLQRLRRDLGWQAK